MMYIHISISISSLPPEKPETSEFPYEFVMQAILLLSLLGVEKDLNQE